VRLRGTLVLDTVSRSWVPAEDLDANARGAGYKAALGGRRAAVEGGRAPSKGREETRSWGSHWEVTWHGLKSCGSDLERQDTREGD